MHEELMSHLASTRLSFVALQHIDRPQVGATRQSNILKSNFYITECEKANFATRHSAIHGTTAQIKYIHETNICFNPEHVKCTGDVLFVRVITLSEWASRVFIGRTGLKVAPWIPAAEVSVKRQQASHEFCSQLMLLWWMLERLRVRQRALRTCSAAFLIPLLPSPCLATPPASINPSSPWYPYVPPRKKTGQHLAEFMRKRELVDHENWEEFFLGSIVVVAISGGETLSLWKYSLLRSDLPITLPMSMFTLMLFW